jgi:hypothetical protein
MLTVPPRSTTIKKKKQLQNPRYATIDRILYKYSGNWKKMVTLIEMKIIIRMSHALPLMEV